MTNPTMTLPCPMCGSKLSIVSGVNHFACGNCGSGLNVRRDNNIVYLEFAPDSHQAAVAPQAVNIPRAAKKKNWFSKLPAPIQLIIVLVGIIVLLPFIIPRSAIEEVGKANATSTAKALSANKASVSVASSLSPVATQSKELVLVATNTPRRQIRHLQPKHLLLSLRQH